MAEAPEENPTPPSTPPPCTAPGEPLCGAGGNWWGGWIQVAKEKSVSAIEFVKKDIEEFTNTMHSDSESISCNVRSKLNQETAVAASQRVKHGMSYLLEGIKSALIIPPEDMSDDEGEPITISSSKHIFDRAKARLHAVQIDPGTYCEEPSGSKKEYEAWKATCELDGKKGDISELLVANVEVRALYTQMVPSSVSHADFWQRYFYKINQLDQEEQRRADLMKRADVVQIDEDLAWDEEDDWENMENGSPPPHQGNAEGSSRKPETEPKPETEATPELEDRLKPDVSQSDTESAQPAEDTHSFNKTLAEAAPGKTQTEMAPGKTKEEDVVDIPGGETIPSPSDSSLSTTTTTDSKDLTKDCSAETLTVVSSSDLPDDKPLVAKATDSHSDQEKAESLKTKEKGDLVVVGEGTTPRTSPSSSDSHNKESLDEDWEKDFDIEVTEEELRAAHDTAKDLPADASEAVAHDDDWESWE